MKNVAELDVAQAIVTMSTLWSRLVELGASGLTAIEGGSIAMHFADDAGVDRAYSALISLSFAGMHIIRDPHEERSVADDKRWRTAIFCMGHGAHLYLSGPHRPVLQAV